MSKKLISLAWHTGKSLTSVCKNHIGVKRIAPFASISQYFGRYFAPLLVLLFSTFFYTPIFGQCTLTCDDQKNISLSTSGYAIIYPELVLNGDFSCAGPITITILDENNQDIGDTLKCEHVGRTFQVGARSALLNIDCWSTIVVEDKLGPIISCSDTMLACSASILPEVLGYPSVRDNCATPDQANLKYFDLYTELTCGAMHNGIPVNARITRSWTMLDPNGNVGTCTQNIYLRKDSVQSIVFPGHRDDINGPAISCTVGNPKDPTTTGEPLINGQPIRNGDACKIFVGYQDQYIDVCPPASYTIIRRWEVTDLCTQEVRVGIQNILIADRNPPEINCPDSFAVFSHVSSCGTTVILPQATATDSCSDVTVQPTWEFGTGYGPFYDVPVGTHTITYTATDKCGNSAICTSKVTVIDNTQPIAVCRDEVNVALTNDGFAEIRAISFDGGSKDNCSIERWEVSRGNGVFGDTVRFTCADVKRPVSIRLRVYDAAGLSNECTTQVIVKDETAPSIVCPQMVLLDCSLNYKDTYLTGFATATDNCGIQEIYFEDVEDINSCNIGRVTRNWFAVDSSGNLATCQQLIVLADQTPISVTFPADYTTNECGANTAPDSTGRPIITGADCENLLVSHKDEIFLIGDSACLKILRTWTVLDWCTFDPNDTLNGARITKTQLIKIVDEVAPIITDCPTDITVGITDDACEAQVDLPDLAATDCNPNLTITNSSLYATENGPNASGRYPIGEHTIRFLVSDGCGNITGCEMTITVEDQFAPTPVCKFGITITLNENGFVIVPPNVINSGSVDNCSGSENLIYEISPNYFTCEDIGQQTINLIVTDEAGNSQFCSTDIYIQDNGDFCNPNARTTIAGRIFMEDGHGMEEVPVQLSGGLEEMGLTDSEGHYRFENLSRMDTYTIRPMTTDNYQEGLSTFDLVLIRKHILGLVALDSPYKILAADVNNSRTISSYDMVLIRQIVLGTRTNFPDNTSWRYIEASYQFPDPRNPFLETVPEFRDYKRLLINDLERNFIGIKVGDVNNSASPTAMVGHSRTTKGMLQFQVADKTLKEGFEYKIPFTAKDLDQIQGYQFTIDFDKTILQFKEVISGEPITMGQNNFGFQQLENGQLTTSWENAGVIRTPKETILFTLVFKAQKGGQLSQVLRLNSSITLAEAYNQTDDLLAVDLQFATNQSNDKLTLFQNYPNPFENQTIISLTLPKSVDGTISIHDIHGKLLKSYYGKYAQGYNEVEIDLSELHIKTGVLYYQFQAPGIKRLSKKMVLIRE